MELTTVWFILITVLWTGYFVLEGFDFGVGMLLPFLSKGVDAEDTEKRKRVMLNTIGPVWDGNEVWVLTAGGATFAAFPFWYATLFDGFYLALLLILVALIIRAMGFEYRGKKDSASWRKGWDTCIFIGSLLPALLWGVAFGNIIMGTDLRPNAGATGVEAAAPYVTFQGNLFDLLGWQALVAGLTTLTLFLFHGALFIALKTRGPISEQARKLSVKLGLVAAIFAVALLLVVGLHTGSTLSWIFSALAALCLLGAIFMAYKGNEKLGFWLSFAAIALAVWALFSALFPDVMPSTAGDAFSLTKDNAAATPYTLKIMTVVACIFTPVVLLYQSWTYWSFRKRIGTEHIPDVAPEASTSAVEYAAAPAGAGSDIRDDHAADTDVPPAKGKRTGGGSTRA